MYWLPTATGRENRSLQVLEFGGLERGRDFLGRRTVLSALNQRCLLARLPWWSALANRTSSTGWNGLTFAGVHLMVGLLVDLVVDLGELRV